MSWGPSHLWLHIQIGRNEYKKKYIISLHFITRSISICLRMNFLYSFKIPAFYFNDPEVYTSILEKLKRKKEKENKERKKIINK